MNYHPTVVSQTLGALNRMVNSEPPAYSDSQQYPHAPEYRQALCRAYQAASLAQGHAPEILEAAPFLLNPAATTGLVCELAPPQREITIVSSGTSGPAIKALIDKSDVAMVLATMGAVLLIDENCRTFASRGVGSQSPTQTSPVSRPTVEREFTWISHVYALSKAGSTSKALHEMFWAIEDLLRAKNFFVLNRILENLDISKLAPEIIVGAVRSTFRARLAIPAWYDLLDRARGELKARNVPNWEKLLIGLAK